MTFLTPLIAGIAAAVAIPSLLILYFLKLRRRDVEVSTTLLWKKAIQDLQANAPFQRLRRNILLLLQLLALAAVLFALAQPQIQASTSTGRRHVILIDRSASMSAFDGDGKLPPNADGQRTRLDEAKRRAIELVQALREPTFLGGDTGDQAMVIAFDTLGEVRTTFTSSKSDLRRAIESIEPSDAPTSIDEAFKLAKAYVPKHFEEGKGFVPIGEPAVIHIFSDGRLPDAEKAAPDPDDKVIYHAVGGESTPNFGVTALRADRAFDNPGRLTIFVGVQSTDRQARTVDVELSIDNRIVSVRPVSLAAATRRNAPVPAADSEEAAAARAEEGGEWDPRLSGVVFSLDRPEGGVAVVRLRNPDAGRALDAFPTDDIAYLIIPPARRMAVALVTRGNLFLREALQGLNLSRIDQISPDIFQRMVEGQRINNVGLADFDVIVLDRVLPNVQLTSPDGGPGGTGPGLPPGRVLVLGAVPPPPVGLIDDGVGDTALMVDWKRDHRALRYAGLGELVIAKSRKVRVAPDSPVTVIAQDQYGPAIVEAAGDFTRAMIVPFDPAESDWPLKPGFVLFIASALTHLADDAAGIGGLLQPGQTLADRVPLGSSSVRISFPEASEPARDLFPASDGRVAFGPLRRTGIYLLSWTGVAMGRDAVVDGRIMRPYAVNLLDAAESQIETRPLIPLATGDVAAQGPDSAQATRRLWPYLILTALAVVMLEWFVYNRKVHI